MTLSNHRIAAQGISPHPHEHAALAEIRKILPDTDPYQLWAFVELRAPDGRLYEIDALVLTRHCLFLVEIKAWTGTVRSHNVADFIRELPDGRQILQANPYDLTNSKSRVLASMLDRKMGTNRPHVQALVFLSQAHINLHGAAEACVVGPKKLGDALTRAVFPGAPAWLPTRTVDRKMAGDTVKALRDLGLVASRGQMKIGELELDEVIEEGPGYQDRRAHHPIIVEKRHRVRLYLLPQAASDAHREQLARAAEREARLLLALGDHRYILTAPDYRHEGPHGGPVVVFELFEGGETLDVFLRRNPELPLDDRIEILSQVAEAVAYCHEKRVIHRGLHPGSVLVRRNENGQLETRLYNFQLAARQGGTTGGTIHHTVHTLHQAEIYRAPELFENPQLEVPESDVFSLGALAWFVLVGRPPAGDIAERQRTLQMAKCLPLAAANDALATGYNWAVDLGEEARKSLDDAIRAATDVNPLNRYDSVQEWLEILLDAVTRPDQPDVDKVDPLTARPDDELSGGFTVKKVLGTGSTARVLHVERGGRQGALKVALDEECGHRLLDEGEVLQLVGGRDGIVEYEGAHIVGGRQSLLLGYAGQSLADVLGKQGPPALDLAARWGEDLLRSLVVLEEENVQHRDIKPANVGVADRDGKDARHLVLFDFSLSRIGADKVTAGTPAYRDPFLIGRGRWDTAADRYAAALTLHEMLTGVLPRYGRGDVLAIATDEDVTLEAERFDAGVRRPLANFFSRALSRDVAQRQASAEAMLRDWRACFVDATEHLTSHGEDDAAAKDRASAFDYGSVGPDTPVETLPLSPRARSALDRSGAHTVRDLLGLSRNRLSFIRGVGKDTREAILAVMQAIEDAQPGLAKGAAPEPFRADWRGIDMAVGHVPNLDQEAAAALESADMGQLVRLARAPKSRVDHILDRHAGAREAVLAALDGRGLEAVVQSAPATIDGWVERLLPAGSTRRGEGTQRTAQIAYGIESVEQTYAENADDAAQLLKVSRQAVYAAITLRKDVWKGEPALHLVHDAVSAALDALGGAAPFTKVAEALPEYLPHSGRDVDVDTRRRQALALVRISAETREDLAQLRLNHVLWLARSAELRGMLDSLGKRADELSRRTPLPSPDEAQAAVRDVVAGTPLEGTTDAKLVRIAAWASDGAAASARLEFYPKGLAPDRALLLSSGALSARTLTEAQVQALVAARYPEAEPLPTRPDLDRLLDTLALKWDATVGAYVRPNVPGETIATTSYATHTRPRRTVSPRAERPADEREVEKLDRTLRAAIEQHRFRIVRAISDPEGFAQALAQRFDLEVVSIDEGIVRHARQLMDQHGVPETTVFATDRTGPGGPEWANLRALMEQVQVAFLADLAAKRGVLVLTRPGLLARYKLGGFFDALRELVDRSDHLGALVVVPSSRSESVMLVDGVPESLAIPALDQVHRIDIDHTGWQRRHRATTAVA